ncbi:hypothetical protein GPN2_11461 [Streptomyces murinus]
MRQRVAQSESVGGLTCLHQRWIIHQVASAEAFDIGHRCGVLEAHEREVALQEGVRSDAVRKHVEPKSSRLGHAGDLVQLSGHGLGAADAVPQRRLVEQRPDDRLPRALEHAAALCSVDEEVFKVLGPVVRPIGAVQGACVFLGLENTRNQRESELLDQRRLLLKLCRDREVVVVFRLQVFQPALEEPVRSECLIDPPCVVGLRQPPARLVVTDQSGRTHDEFAQLILGESGRDSTQPQLLPVFLARCPRPAGNVHPANSLTDVGNVNPPPLESVATATPRCDQFATHRSHRTRMGRSA